MNALILSDLGPNGIVVGGPSVSVCVRTDKTLHHDIPSGSTVFYASVIVSLASAQTFEFYVGL